MRNLASIQRILKIEPIPNADAIEVATVLGWKVVVKKDEFRVGDLIIYCEIDSIMPDKPEFEFLKDSNGKMRKIKTVKLRGQISQGIVFPVTILPKDVCAKEGQDVTEILGVTKYEEETYFPPQKQSAKIIYPKWMPKWLISLIHMTPLREWFRKEMQGSKTFPSWIPKTDETRVQVLQPLLTKYKCTKCYVTEKVDGSSITIYLKDGKFGVCSRNIDLAEAEDNVFWKTVRQMDIEEKMRNHFSGNWALQGELLGEGIQGNKLKLAGNTIRFFNVFDIDNQAYQCLECFVYHIETMGLDTVPVITTEYVLDDNIDSLVEMAKGNSVIAPQVKREGIVIRPLSEIEETEEARGKLVRNRLSFKAINPEFLLKFGD
jgi:tRNA-binding EMAP/Myf-like protein